MFMLAFDSIHTHPGSDNDPDLKARNLGQSQPVQAWERCSQKAASPGHCVSYL